MSWHNTGQEKIQGVNFQSSSKDKEVEGGKRNPQGNLKEGRRILKRKVLLKSKEEIYSERRGLSTKSKDKEYK